MPITYLTPCCQGITNILDSSFLVFFSREIITNSAPGKSEVKDLKLLASSSPTRSVDFISIKTSFCPGLSTIRSISTPKPGAKGGEWVLLEFAT
jgi:hypothetical protein